MKLSDKPARTDLTDRECTRIIGGVIGCLAGMTTITSLRNAVRWWADTDEAWQMIEAQEAAMRATFSPNPAHSFQPGGLNGWCKVCGAEPNARWHKGGL